MAIYIYILARPCSGMPEECLPCDGKRGRLSYTIYNEASGAKVEVLLKGRAFRISKLARFDKKGYLALPFCSISKWVVFSTITCFCL